MFHKIQSDDTCQSTAVVFDSLKKSDEKNNSLRDQVRHIRNSDHAEKTLCLKRNLQKKHQLLKRKHFELNLINPTNKQIISRGIGGDVWLDPNDTLYVIKSFARLPELVQQECDMFNRFYGEGSAELFTENDHIHMRMRKVPGYPFSSLLWEDYPKNGKELLLNMIVDMNDLGIIHADLHMGNIMYDSEANRFWPIDISNSYESYYSLDSTSKEFANRHYNKEFTILLNALP